MVARNLGSTGDPSGDSAGVPWAGRQFEDNSWSEDDGSAPERVIEAIARFRMRELGEQEVVDALRNARLLIPLIAELGESGTAASGLVVDKSQELSIVTVSGPDGRTVLPAFTSSAAMKRWDPKARPVPTDSVRIALAAASEQTDLVVIDPTSPTEFVLRRPALWALAQSLPWQPSYVDGEVRAAFADAVSREPAVVALTLVAGDPDSRLAGPELVVQLALVNGLDRDALGVVLQRLQAAWSTSEVIAARVDSLRVQFVPAD